MNDVEKKHCIMIMNQMQMMHLFEPIKTNDLGSIDLNVILEKLKDNNYQSINEWKEDIERIWLPSMKLNKPGSLEYSFAQEQQKWFEKHLIKIPHSNLEEWYMKMKKISKEIKNLLHTPPNEVYEPIIIQSKKDD